MEPFNALLQSILSQAGLIAAIAFFFWWTERNERLSDKKDFLDVMKQVEKQMADTVLALTLIKDHIGTK
jgi:hypothetical protein